MSGAGLSGAHDARGVNAGDDALRDAGPGGDDRPNAASAPVQQQTHAHGGGVTHDGAPYGWPSPKAHRAYPQRARKQAEPERPTIPNRESGPSITSSPSNPSVQRINARKYSWPSMSFSTLRESACIRARNMIFHFDSMTGQRLTRNGRQETAAHFHGNSVETTNHHGA